MRRITDKQDTDLAGLKFDNDIKAATLEKRLSLDRNFYNKKYHVTDFCHSSVIDRAYIKALVEKYRIPRQISVLDLGCGTGAYSILFAELGFNVTGLDFSLSGIARAKSLYGEKINWLVGDALKMPFDPNREFDVIFCSDFSPFTLIDELQEATEVAKKIFECLKKDGLFIFVWSSVLSGKRMGKSVIIEYTPLQIREIFSSLGAIVGDVFTTNKQLFPLFGKHALNRLITWITSRAVRIHHRNVRIVCGVKKKQ